MIICLPHSVKTKHCGLASKKGVYEVGSCYNVLRVPTRVSFQWKSIWTAKVPGKVAFFVWIVAL